MDGTAHKQITKSQIGVRMSSRLYRLNINDLEQMIGPYLRQKFPELASLSTETDVKVKISKGEITVEVIS